MKCLSMKCKLKSSLSHTNRQFDPLDFSRKSENSFRERHLQLIGLINGNSLMKPWLSQAYGI